MKRLAGIFILSVASAAVVFAQEPSTGDREQEVHKALATFERNWKQPRGLMPFGDLSWKARMEAISVLIKADKTAVPALLAALKSEKASTRGLAAQVLGLIADKNTQPALLSLLKDRDNCVRMLAAQALSQFGRLEPAEQYRPMVEKEQSWLVQAHMSFALQRDDAPNPKAIRQAILEYDLASMDTAAVSKPAPEFQLPDTSGKVYRLSDFRGKKVVALVFLAADL